MKTSRPSTVVLFCVALFAGLTGCQSAASTGAQAVVESSATEATSGEASSEAVPPSAPAEGTSEAAAPSEPAEGTAEAGAPGDSAVPDAAAAPSQDTACGASGQPCAAGEFCQTPDGQCGATGQATCTPIPQMCTMDYRPVCGCDGNTYGNPCGAASAGVSVAAEGECGGAALVVPTPPATGDTTCTTAADCSAGLSCDTSAATACDVPNSGVCRSLTLARCTREYMPVCGCDGVTYPNDCVRVSAGVAAKSQGECP